MNNNVIKKCKQLISKDDWQCRLDLVLNIIDDIMLQKNSPQVKGDIVEIYLHLENPQGWRKYINEMNEDELAYQIAARFKSHTIWLFFISVMKSRCWFKGFLENNTFTKKEITLIRTAVSDNKELLEVFCEYEKKHCCCEVDE